MPKMKSHSGAGKRFKVTKSGKVKRSNMNRRHILTKMTTKRKRDLRQGSYVDKTQELTIKTLLPY